MINSRPYYSLILTGLICCLIFSSSAFADIEAARSAAEYHRSTGEIVYHGRSTHSHLDELIISEDFNSRVFPPIGWEVQTQNTGDPTYTWFAQDFNPYEGSFNAGVLWDPLLSPQDEWLISPAFSLPDEAPADTNIRWDIRFNWMMSYNWGVYPEDNYDLELRMSLNGGEFSTILWDEESEGVFNNFQWYETSIDLIEYAGNSNVRLAWRYAGSNGAEAGIDIVSLLILRERVDIPDEGSASWTIDVATDEIIEDLDITLNVTHSYISDMSFSLQSPFDTQVQLIEISEGSPSGANLTNTRFDDQAADTFAYSEGQSNYSGNWIPAEPLNAFNGHSAQGVWTLIAFDNAAGDTGWFNDVELHINSMPPVETDTFTIESSIRQPLTDIDVTLNVTHPMISEMTFVLESPLGTRVQLVNQEPFNLRGENFIETRLDDEAATDFAFVDNTSNYTGSWRPAEALTVFDGEDPSGTWKLIGIDHVPGNAGTIDNVVLHIDTTPQNISDLEPAIPASVHFMGNYPNPFNPSTTLSFELPAASYVKLRVYNTVGQQVAELINGRVSAGLHRARFDGVNLASGIYFASFEADDYKATHKMILLK